MELFTRYSKLPTTSIPSSAGALGSTLLITLRRRVLLAVTAVGAGLLLLYLLWGGAGRERAVQSRAKQTVVVSCEQGTVISSEDDQGRRWDSPTLSLPSGTPLSDRLSLWRSAPLTNSSTWASFNAETCSEARIQKVENKLHSRENAEFWQSLNEQEIRNMREELVGVLERAMAEDVLDMHGRATHGGTGRGIVFTAGNGDTFSRVIVSLQLLRSYGTTLPAEVFHFASESPSEAENFKLISLGATLRLVDVRKDLGEPTNPGEADEKRVKNFHIKGDALRWNSFAEFLYLDSDSLPAKDVTPLFDALAKDGALFWPDFWKDVARNGIWSILGVQCRDEWTMEAGQILISKREHLDALLLFQHMQNQFPTFFRFSDGDKDLLRYAFLALRKPWSVPGQYLNSVSFPSESGVNEILSKGRCGHTMLQYDALGEPAFVHANLLKRYQGDFDKDSTWGKTNQLSDLESLLPYFHFAQPWANISTDSDIISADELANTDYTTGLGILPGASVKTRVRALMEGGLSAELRSDYRIGFYVLCVDTRFTLPPMVKIQQKRDWLSFLPGWGSRCPSTVKLKRVDWQAIADSDPLHMVDWKESSVLEDFPEQFYAVGGKANGEGF